jgi:hypothetical protein
MRKSIKITLGFIFSIIITYFLLRIVSLNELVRTISESDKGLILLALFVYFLIAIGRAIRFQKVSRLKSLKSTFSIVCIHNFLNNVMPFKTGELSYPVMIKRKFNIPFSKALSDLALVRFFDLMALGTFLILAILFSLQYFNNLLLYASLSLILVFIAFLIIYKMGKIVRSRRTNFNNKLINKISNFILLVLSNLSRRNKKEIVFIAIFSFIIFSLLFFVAYLLIRALGLEIPIYLVIIGGALSVLATLIPIQGPLNLGTVELGFIFPFVIYGIIKEQAISVSFGYHLFVLIFSLLLFFVGFSIFNSKKL